MANALKTHVLAVTSGSGSMATLNVILRVTGLIDVAFLNVTRYEVATAFRLGQTVADGGPLLHASLFPYCYDAAALSVSSKATVCSTTSQSINASREEKKHGSASTVPFYAPALVAESHETASLAVFKIAVPNGSHISAVSPMATGSAVVKQTSYAVTCFEKTKTNRFIKGEI